MRLLLHVTCAALVLVCSALSSRAESSAGKVFKLSEALEFKVAQLQRTKERTVMLRYVLTNSGTQNLEPEALGFHQHEWNGATGIRLIDMAGRKRFGCMNVDNHCVGSKGTTLDSGASKEFWVYLTEPSETATSVLLQVGDYPPQPVTIDPAQ